MKKEWPSDWEEKEQRAFNLLQWNPYSLPTDFNWELAALGHYTKLQTERSDKALDEFDSINERQASEELAAFHELERLGVYTQADYFSPSQAQNGFYAKTLKDHKRRVSSGLAEGDLRTQGTREDCHDDIRTQRMAARHAQSSGHGRSGSGRSRQGTAWLPRRGKSS